MKKTLIALAAVAATGAFAQSSVTISGNLDQTYFNQGTNNSKWGSNNNSTSLWSLSGVEDLGGGMKASFTLISEINVQSGSAASASTSNAAATEEGPAYWNRGANVAVSGGFGEVRVGRQNGAWWETQGAFNTSGSNSYGFGNMTANQTNSSGYALTGSASAWAVDYGATGTGGNTGTSPWPFASGVSYKSPDMGGLTAKIGVTSTDYLDQGDRTGYTYSLNYAKGPLKAAYAFGSVNDTTGSVAQTQTFVGASYTVGNLTGTVAYNKAVFKNALEAMDDSTAIGLGVTYRVNPKVDVAFSYSTLTDDEDTANKATVMGLTARYALSKRTSVYAGLGNVKNEGASTISAIYAGSVQPANSTTGSYMAGLRHSF